MDYTKRTSVAELGHIARILKVINFAVCRLIELPRLLQNKNIYNIVINLDSVGSGSHWVALCKNKKLYFDSYAQPAPYVVPRNYKLASQSKEVQSIAATDCGALCLLWLHYVNYKSNAEYYSHFKDVY